VDLLVGVGVAIVLGAFELQPRRLVFARADRGSGPLIALSLLVVVVVAAVTRSQASMLLEALGAAAAAAGLALRVWSQRTLGRDYSYVAREPAALCTSGPYRFMRHPAYLGTCLYAVAAPLWFASPVAAALVPLVLAAVLYRIRLEETLLERA
jgi:protein-S-isoprenylcysteine O-methyltransferase Ste14